MVEAEALSNDEFYESSADFEDYQFEVHFQQHYDETSSAHSVSEEKLLFLYV